MNRWYVSSLAVLIVGVAVAFIAVPYDIGGCPTGVDTACTAYGSVPRITTLFVTALAALVLAIIGSVGTSSRRP